MIERTCKKCGKIKPIEEFKGERIDSFCIVCHKEYKRIWAQMHRDQYLNYKKRNRNSINNKAKTYRQKNKDKIKAYRFMHSAKIKNYMILYNKIYYHNNNQKIKKQVRKYYRKNIEQIKLYKDHYNRINKDKISSYKKHIVRELCDSYIIRFLHQETGINVNVLKKYPALIEAKQIQIKLKRLANEKCD